jgi:predicted metal-binding membrane protein
VSPRAAGSSAPTPIESLLGRDRLVILIGLGTIVLLSWAYLLAGSGTGMSVRAMSTWRFPPDWGSAFMPASPWDAGYWLLMLLMWWVMMTAMMTPSAAPVILLYARVARQPRSKGESAPIMVPTASFATGYLAAWFAFSLAATVAQWLLERAGLMSQMLMWSTTARLSAALLVAAGAYQLSPLKNACLAQCRSPVAFITRHWRKGPWGALRMGAIHGAICVGCCGGLMVLLFAGGLMNLLWIAGLAVIVLVEKLLPGGRLVARLAGLALVAWGAWLLVGA